MESDKPLGIAVIVTGKAKEIGPFWAYLRDQLRTRCRMHSL